MQVGIEGITYAGNHGLEIIHPDGTKFVHPVPAELEGKVRDLLKSLQDQVCFKGRFLTLEMTGSTRSVSFSETATLYV